MADLDGLKVAKDYHVDTPFANNQGFYVKGANNLDWGMQKHLSNIFDPKSGNTVMFAFDHGYFMGSTAGLERLDLLLPQLAPYVDCFMGTRGAIRTCVSPEVSKGIALRVSSGSSMLQSDLSHEVVAVDIEDAIRMNADCMAVQTFIGADGQLSSIDNLSQIVKTYDCEDFEEVVAACPVPIVVAGGKKLAERDALHLAYDVIRKGARGVDMGRNIFQSTHPLQMAEAVRMIVHEGATDAQAWEFFEDATH